MSERAEELHKLADQLWDIGTTDEELDAVGVLRRKAAELEAKED